MATLGQAAIEDDLRVSQVMDSQFYGRIWRAAAKTTTLKQVSKLNLYCNRIKGQGGSFFMIITLGHLILKEFTK